MTKLFQIYKKSNFFQYMKRFKYKDCLAVQDVTQHLMDNYDEYAKRSMKAFKPTVGRGE